MSQKTLTVIAGVAAIMIAGCGSTSPTANSSPASSASASAASSPSAQPSAVATTTDPCQLVTPSEASSLTGVTYSAGTQETSGVCVYGSQTLNVFEVAFAQAASPADANAQWSQYEAKAQSTLTQAAQQIPGLTVNISVSDISVAGFDRAATGTFSATYQGHTFSASALYTLKGADFFAMSDLTASQPPPTAAALEAQAQTSSARLP